MPDPTEFLDVVPNFALGDLAWFAGWVGVAVVLPGHALRRLSRLRPAAALERWAIACVFGVLATSLLYYVLAAAGLQRFHPPLVVLLAAMAGAIISRDVFRETRKGKGPRFGRRFARGKLPAAEKWARLVAVTLIAALPALHLAQVASLVEFDATGVRLFGAMFSDKMTNMSSCAALVEGVPPASLRMSGYVFPSHYFPHLFVAAADRAVGVDGVDGFWFHAAALGVVIQSLAVLAFGRRFLRSTWLALAGLALYAIARFTTETKPLDLSLALLLVGLVALDRHACGGRRRWAAAAIGLVAAMPLYEVFTTLAALGGLGLWAAAPAARALRRRAIRPALGQVAARLPVALLACLGAFLAVQVVYVGADVRTSPEPIARNSYRDSYKHEWIDLLGESEDGHPALAAIYRWHRGKPAAAPGDSAPSAPPGVFERAAGTAVYHLGFIGYFLARFVNLAVFGIVAVWVALRAAGPRSKTAWSAMASISAFGFGVPWFLSWGHTAAGRWYETPNIYRLSDCGYVLLVVVGVPVLFRAIRQWRRPRWWPALGLAAWQCGVFATAMCPTTAFHHVDFDRLAVLRFLRTEVAPGEIVLHPWTDDLIRDARRPEEVAWVYKRHFTLGSNLAGRQMYYEGREDHLFINGAVTADDVLARRRLREAFYARPTPEVVRRVLDQGVAWVVEDDANPAPAEIRDRWRLAYAAGAVRVYGPWGPR